MKLDARKKRKNSHHSIAFTIKFQITVKSFLQMLANKLVILSSCQGTVLYDTP